MPPSICPIICTAVLLLFFTVGTPAQAQDSDSTEQDSTCHTISFSLGDYDVISSIYVFLSSGNQAPSCRVEILSIRKRGGLGWLLPTPLSLDILFKEAMNRHYEQGHLPCDQTPDALSVQTLVNDSNGLSSILFTLYSLLHLGDVWNYSVDCSGNNGLLISFVEFLDESLLE